MFLICMYPHAPEQRLVCCHHYRLPGVSMGNRFIGVGRAHKFSKLQDLVICGGDETASMCAVMNSAVEAGHILGTLCSQVFRVERRST